MLKLTIEHKILLDFIMNLLSLGEINYVAKRRTLNLQFNLGIERYRAVGEEGATGKDLSRSKTLKNLLLFLGCALKN